MELAKLKEELHQAQSALAIQEQRLRYERSKGDAEIARLKQHNSECAYCGSRVESRFSCSQCGAPLPAKKKPLMDKLIAF